MNPIIKWSGSKRSQASQILKYLPEKFGVYFEPFIGGGSMLYAINPQKAICGDICQSLVDLWNMIRDNPVALAIAYKKRWQRLQNEGYETYYTIRNEFNSSHKPEDLLFLTRTCVNGLIRFNSNGDFNNSLHHTRKGMRPDKMREIIIEWSGRIQNASFMACDYSESLANMRKNDLVYLDPPYFHTKGRYYGTIDYDAFLAWLDRLNSVGVFFMLSFDGKREDKDYSVKLPKSLYKRHIMLPSGNSSFRKVMGKKCERVYESLYLNW